MFSSFPCIHWPPVFLLRSVRSRFCSIHATSTYHAVVSPASSCHPSRATGKPRELKCRSQSHGHLPTHLPSCFYPAHLPLPLSPYSLMKPRPFKAFKCRLSASSGTSPWAFQGRAFGLQEQTPWPPDYRPKGHTLRGWALAGFFRSLAQTWELKWIDTCDWIN